MNKINKELFKGINKLIQAFTGSLTIWLKLETKTLPGKINSAGVALVICFVFIFHCFKGFQNLILAFRGKSTDVPSFWGTVFFIIFTIISCAMLLSYCERPKFKDR